MSAWLWPVTRIRTATMASTLDKIDLAALLALQHVLAVALVGIEGTAGVRCKLNGSAGCGFSLLWAFAGQPPVLRVDPAGQGQGFDALPPLGLEQFHFGIKSSDSCRAVCSDRILSSVLFGKFFKVPLQAAYNSLKQ
jgi:hypothetical protein